MTNLFSGGASRAAPKTLYGRYGGCNAVPQGVVGGSEFIDFMSAVADAVDSGAIGGVEIIGGLDSPHSITVIADGGAGGDSDDGDVKDTIKDTAKDTVKTDDKSNNNKINDEFNITGAFDDDSDSGSDRDEDSDNISDSEYSIVRHLTKN